MTGKILCALCVLGLGAVASAQEIQGASPKTSAFEFKLGGFKPMIERESALGSNPYNATFGASAMLLGEFEYDRQLFQRLGSAAIGASIGYAEKYGAANAVASTSQTVVENTALKILPIRLLGVYRFDWAALNYSVPLVPYAKLGLVYTAWWVTKGDDVEYVNGERAAGGKWGYQGTLGLSVMLDMLEPRLARDFDTDLGVNHSYLFAEYTYADVNNFGAPGLDLSTRHWMFGLTLEY